jgi:Tol biopolymer transport system component/predicted Ser/Thr protein kinase
VNEVNGSILGAYRIQSELGRGGMAVVYKAYQPALERYVAIKVLPQELTFDDEFVQRFLREARAAAKLNHPGIVTIHDVGQADGTYFIVMEYVEGPSLTDLLRRQGALPPQRVVQIVSQVASALDYAHRHGFVHRDVKPSNILLDSEGRAKLTDFGIVKAAEGTRLTQTGTLLGTPEYMSPEQAIGESTGPATDIYSLAVVAYELLSGRTPFRGETMAVLHAHAYERPDLNTLPRSLRSVVGKPLSKTPRQRHESAGAFAEALHRATFRRRPDEEPGTERPMPLARVPTWLWGVGAAVLVLGVVLAFLRSPSQVTTPEATEPPVSEIPGGSAIPPSPTRTATSTSTPVSGPRATSQSQLVPELTSTASPLSERGGMLAFDSYRNDHWDIYTLNADGSGLVNLTNHPANDGDPSWSPNGQRIAFDTDRDGNWEIYAMTADGSRPERLTNVPADDDHPAWSPDGQRIAFRSNRDGNWEIYLMDLADLSVANLSRHPADEQTPAWSPDGQQLAFASDRGGNWDLYVISADGSALSKLTHHQADDSFPAWAPNGRRIAFRSTRDGDGEIYLMNPDSTGLVRLTDNSSEDWGPHWSSNGERIAFTSDRSGNNDIYVMNADGSGVSRLTYSNASDTWPVWKPVATGSEERVEACTLRPGMVIRTAENARLWAQPDVTAAPVISNLAADVPLTILDGPSWGRIRSDIDESGWWWKVQPQVGGKPGWLWQSRIHKCVVQEATPVAICATVSGPFANVWDAVRSEIGCSSGSPIQGQIVEENFEGGKMFWREPIDAAQALVLYDDGTWQIFKHAPYQESMPEFPCTDATTPAQCPPTPKRGFGTMWCDIPEIRGGLGDATDCERGYSGWMQRFEQGAMLQTEQGINYILLDNGRWERR